MLSSISSYIESRCPKQIQQFTAPQHSAEKNPIVYKDCRKMKCAQEMF